MKVVFLGAEMNMDPIDLSMINPSAEILTLLSSEQARLYEAIPIDMDGTSVDLVLGDPLDQDGIDNLGHILGKSINPRIAYRGDVLEALHQLYGLSENEKEKGFFAKVGLEQGMRSGFVFLIKSDEDWNEMPEYITCTLAEKNYSFMKILHFLNGRDEGTFKVGEKLTLIRSAELTNPENPSDIKEEFSISQADPQ